MLLDELQQHLGLRGYGTSFLLLKGFVVGIVVFVYNRRLQTCYKTLNPHTVPFGIWRPLQGWLLRGLNLTEEAVSNPETSSGFEPSHKRRL